MNITIINIVSKMRFLKNRPLMFSDDVTLCAMYVKNLCPFDALRKILLVKCGMDEIFS